VLESRLWAAANALRGPVDPADFKAYIFPLLFYKRICDAWDEEHEQAANDYDDLLDDEVEADYHRFVIPDGCHWEDIRRLHENVGVGLQRSLDRIQQATLRRWRESSATSRGATRTNSQRPRC
jgi:type I restriction enzyme M protein